MTAGEALDVEAYPEDARLFHQGAPWPEWVCALLPTRLSAGQPWHRFAVLFIPAHMDVVIKGVTPYECGDGARVYLC